MPSGGNAAMRRGPRYVVRELTGGQITGTGRRSNSRDGTTVWVADEAMAGKEVRVWRTESVPKGVHWSPLDRCRFQARALADRLNEEEAACM